MRHIDIGRLEEIEGWPPGSLKYSENEESGDDITEESKAKKAKKRKKLTPEKWREKLEEANAALRDVPPGKTRADIFDTYSELWSAVKEEYRRLSHEKCWYCESKTHRMFGDIDHYRPKGRITGLSKEEHSGYWWLAFDWRNWRFACDLCNRKLEDLATDKVGGKGNEFPLWNREQDRIRDEDEYEYYEDLLNEIPLLLDPTERGDPQLLTFNREGLPVPAAEDSESCDYRRAEESIRIYHLYHTKLNRERQRIFREVRDLVHVYQQNQTKWEQENDLSARHSARRALKTLGRMIAPNAEYSMAARAYLREYRKEEEKWKWIDRLLTAS